MTPTGCKHLAAAAAVLALAGCGSESGSALHDYKKILDSAFAGSLGKNRVTLEQAAAIPYASMGWRLNGGNEAILVLATDNGHEQLWTSAAHVVLTTQDGRLKRTVGLPHDMTGLVPKSSGEAMAPAKALQGPFSQEFVADFAGFYNVSLSCRATSKGMRMIEILGKALKAIRVEEDCHSTTLNWSFVNIYWIDPEKMLVWRSHQHVHPGGDEVDTEVLRPPE